jgi:hypothetical protein
MQLVYVIYNWLNFAMGYSVGEQDSIPGSEQFSFLHSVQTGSRSHPASYPVSTRGFSPKG